MTPTNPSPTPERPLKSKLAGPTNPGLAAKLVLARANEIKTPTWHMGLLVFTIDGADDPLHDIGDIDDWKTTSAKPVRDVGPLRFSLEQQYEGLVCQQ